MILTCQDGSGSKFLLDNRVGSVPTYIVKCVDLALAVFDQEKVETSLCDADVVPRLHKS